MLAKVGHNQGPALDPNERWDSKPRLGQSYARPKVPIRDLPAGLIPDHWLVSIETNDKREPDGSLSVKPCCRRIRTEGAIEAWYSSPAARASRMPDIYVMTCTECAALHRVFCVGGSPGSGANARAVKRPQWSAA